jgi:hypothetical protein
VGFAFAFLFRKQLNLSLLDGLYINVFATGPLCILLFLGLNRIESYEPNGGKYVLELENNAYEAFWRIRNVRYDSRLSRMHDIEFTFSDGLFGYKELRSSELF